jgi:hypothetical protein
MTEANATAFSRDTRFLPIIIHSPSDIEHGIYLRVRTMAVQRYSKGPLINNLVYVEERTCSSTRTAEETLTKDLFQKNCPKKT